jgi:hypothetical protein
MSVNSNSLGNIERSFLLLAVFLYCPSDFDVSNCRAPRCCTVATQVVLLQRTLYCCDKRLTAPCCSVLRCVAPAGPSLQWLPGAHWHSGYPGPTGTVATRGPLAQWLPGAHWHSGYPGPTGTVATRGGWIECTAPRVRRWHAHTHIRTHARTHAQQRALTSPLKSIASAISCATCGPHPSQACSTAACTPHAAQSRRIGPIPPSRPAQRRLARRVLYGVLYGVV